jgi:hypothetical protein
MITDGDLNLIKYFWREKGDIERWCDFKEKKEELRIMFPSLIRAWEDYKHAEVTLNALVDSLYLSEEELI